MKSTSYILGFICGLLIVLVVGIIIRLAYKKKGGSAACEYDERQEAIRGTGFKYAYFTAMIVLVIGGILEMLGGAAWCGLFTLAMIAVWASICVFTTYCVIKDAYFSLRARRKALIAIFIAAGVINVCFGVSHIIDGTIIEGGVLSLNAVNLLTGASCLYLGIMMLCRSIYERRMEDCE